MANWAAAIRGFSYARKWTRDGEPFGAAVDDDGDAFVLTLGTAMAC
jgi:hypothetical protein